MEPQSAAAVVDMCLTVVGSGQIGKWEHYGALIAPSQCGWLV